MDIGALKGKEKGFEGNKEKGLKTLVTPAGGMTIGRVLT